MRRVRAEYAHQAIRQQRHTFVTLLFCLWHEIGSTSGAQRRDLRGFPTPRWRVVWLLFDRVTEREQCGWGALLSIGSESCE